MKNSMGFNLTNPLCWAYLRDERNICGAQGDRGATTLPKYLSSDHDPLYRFHQWEANLPVLNVEQIKTVPYVPLSQSVH
jgi:hypothetical protein